MSGTTRRVAGTRFRVVAAGVLLTCASPSFARQALPPAQTQGSATQVAAPPKPPLPNRLNEVLPSWLRVRGEFRGRVEGFENAGFTPGRDDLYWLNRFRINAAVTATRSLSFQVQTQDARVAAKQVGATGAPFKAALDFRTAFADIGNVTAPLAVRLGRQELVFGEQRLVGHANWANAARTFDAARVTVRRKTLQVDAFAASIVRILDGELDKSGNGNRFVGAYAASTSLVPLSSVEPYVLWRHDELVRTELGAFADMNQTTVGVRWAGRLPSKFEYGIETALQTGSVGDDRIHAWAGHYRLRTPPGPRALRLTTEFNYASGDPAPTDGRRGTFDQLYPTPHDKYGLADQVAWKNIQHVRAAVDLTPVKGWPVTSAYHSWWLAEKTDALYVAGGAVLVPRVPGGAASSHVGQELDVQVGRAITPQLTLAAGYAHIFPGPFLKQATPGASYSHPFAMITYVFLAER